MLDVYWPLRTAVALIANDAGQALALPRGIAHESNRVSRVAVAACKTRVFVFQHFEDVYWYMIYKKNFFYR